MSIKPLFKCPGAKTKLADTIISKIPKNIIESGNYHYVEPFLGAGAVFLKLFSSGANFKTFHLNDYNQDITNLWYHLLSIVGSKLLLDEVEQLENIYHLTENKQQFYLSVREVFNQDTQFTKISPIGDLSRAARFLFLNKTCFNGLIRYNKSGQFNVPFGKYKNPLFINKTTAKRLADLASANISKIDLNPYCIKQEGHDFQVYLEEVIKLYKKDRLFVYLDPPYIPLTVTSSFTDYTSEGFGLYDQYRLKSVLKLLDIKGHKFILSNSASPTTKEIFNEYNFTEIKANRNINCIGTKRQKVSEYLITNY